MREGKRELGIRADEDFEYEPCKCLPVTRLTACYVWNLLGSAGDLYGKDMSPAKMPEHRIDKPPVPLSKTNADDVSYISFTDVVVDARDRSTYVEANATVRRKAFNTVKVIREADGYHLIIFDKDTTFRPRDMKEVTGQLVPVIKITEENIARSQKDADLESLTLRALGVLTPRDAEGGQSHAPRRAGAKMTSWRLQGDEPTLLEAPGDEFRVWIFNIVVDQDGSTYIRSDAKITFDENPFALKVKREADGYHLFLNIKPVGSFGMFTRRNITDYSDLIPIVKVTEDVTPEPKD